MKSIEWWRGTAQHMWRTFFAIGRNGLDVASLPETNRKIYDICLRIYQTQFVSGDQDILRMYFTSRWGDDLHAVEDYSLKQNIPTKVVWIVIKRAERAVIESLGIIEKKNGKE